MEWSEGSILLPCVYKVFRISILSILALSMLHDSKFCFHASMEYLMFSLILSSVSQWPHSILTPREQPDLNYWNPLIVQEMRDILQFWTDRRVPLYKIGHFHHILSLSMSRLRHCQGCWWLPHGRRAFPLRGSPVPGWATVGKNRRNSFFLMMLGP